jgi:hypothetical protein
MADTDWQWCFAPSSSDGMDVTSTDTAGIDSNVNVTIFKGFQLELLLGEVAPVFVVSDHESLRCLWIRHLWCELLMGIRSKRIRDV